MALVLLTALVVAASPIWLLGTMLVAEINEDLSAFLAVLVFALPYAVLFSAWRVYGWTVRRGWLRPS